jgi:hypothetical protein
LGDKEQRYEDKNGFKIILHTLFRENRFNKTF